MSHLVYIDACKSTNEEILGYLDANPSDYFALFTCNQTQGRGQYGNTWDIEAGLNLAFTMAVKQQVHLLPELFNFRTAVLLAEFLAKMAAVAVDIKWPNDIIIKDKKVSGILTEKKNIDNEQYLIVGIGLNILQTDFSKLPKAGSLLTQTGISFKPQQVAAELFDFLKEGFARPISADETTKLVNHHLYRKERISVFELNGVRQNGIIKQVDREGYLWVDLENDGLQRFFHKQIQLLY